MPRLLSVTFATFFFAVVSFAVDLQGVVTDWNCTQDMVQRGREHVLKQRRSCLLAKDFHRSVYGLITDDKKFYKIDPAGNPRVLEILGNSPDKDNLRVVISGDLHGNVVKIANITIL